MIGHAGGMAEKRNPLGPTGETLRVNITTLRERRNLTYAELSRRLKGAGRAIPELGLRRIEGGHRRVDVDDLVAIAAALEVSPITLLMPQAADANEAAATSVGTVTAGKLWRWLAAETPLFGDTPSDALGFMLRSVPDWLVGTDYNLVESGLAPNRIISMRRREQIIEVEADANGDD